MLGVRQVPTAKLGDTPSLLEIFALRGIFYCRREASAWNQSSIVARS